MVMLFLYAIGVLIVTVAPFVLFYIIGNPIAKRLGYENLSEEQKKDNDEGADAFFMMMDKGWI